MEYFELFQSEKVESAVNIIGLDEKYRYQMTEKDFASLDRMKVAYYRGLESEEVCDILIEPTWMVSDELKKLLTLYEPESEYKGVQLYPFAEEQEECPLYWVPAFPKISCLHADSVILDNGMTNKLILDRKKITGHSIFRIAGILEYKIVVTMPLAESILRRRLYGIGLKKIEVK